MLVKGVFLASWAALGVAGHGHSHAARVAGGREKCGFDSSADEAVAFRARVEEESAAEQDARVAAAFGRAPFPDRRYLLESGDVDGFPTLVFPVSYLSVCTDDGRNCSTQDEVEAALEYANEVSFNGTGISFDLVEFEMFNNSNWHSNACSDYTVEAQMKWWRVNSGVVANVTKAVYVYGVDCLTDGLYGFAYFPEDYEDDYWQGIVQDYRTLPCGTIGNHTVACPQTSECGEENCEGATFVHEFGHFLGLDHTFEGGCLVRKGDYVIDTPPVRKANYRCPSGYEAGTWDPSSFDSCSESPNEFDMITNFMDYGDDHCLEKFTPGQIGRMFYTAVRFRPTLVNASATIHSSTSCIAGTFFNATLSQCKVCSSGTYQNEHGQTSCKACPSGSLEVTYEGNYRYDQCWEGPSTPTPKPTPSPTPTPTPSPTPTATPDEVSSDSSDYSDYSDFSDYSDALWNESDALWNESDPLWNESDAILNISDPISDLPDTSERQNQTWFWSDISDSVALRPASTWGIALAPPLVLTWTM